MEALAQRCKGHGTTHSSCRGKSAIKIRVQGSRTATTAGGAVRVQCQKGHWEPESENKGRSEQMGTKGWLTTILAAAKKGDGGQASISPHLVREITGRPETEIGKGKSQNLILGGGATLGGRKRLGNETSCLNTEQVCWRGGTGEKTNEWKGGMKKIVNSALRSLIRGEMSRSYPV